MAILAGAALSSHAQKPELEKTWPFQGKTGRVEIQVMRYQDDNGSKATSLHIYSPDGGTRMAAEEGQFFAKVLDELPSAGVSLQSLNWLSFRLNEPDAISKVASCAASSDRWRASLKTKSPSAVYPLVTACIRSSGALDGWDRVFKQHGLKLEVAGVEEVIMQQFSQANAKCPTGANCNGLIVPKDAMVQVNIVPVVRK